MGNGIPKPSSLGEEIWHLIPTPSGNYEISTSGGVRSKARYLINKSGRKRFWKTRILKATLGGQGYYCIVLEGVNYWVHRLVAKAFIPNPEQKPCVNHKDGDRVNNHVDNLEWVTHQENMDHSMQLGLHANTMGSKQHMAKLNEADVHLIRSLLHTGVSIKDVAARFVVSRGTIELIKNYKSWKHVK